MQPGKMDSLLKSSDWETLDLTGRSVYICSTDGSTGSCIRDAGVNLRIICIASALAFSSLLLLALPPQERIPSAEAKKLKNPVPCTRKSIAQGRISFARYCTPCHGPDGKAQVDVVADATDLTSPGAFKSGVSDGEIFRSIRDGAGETMPPFKTQIDGDTDLWHLVNYIHSLWPEQMRPPLEKDKSKEKDR